MIKGKGMFVWIIPDCEGGDIEAIAARASERGLQHLLVKIADGVGPFNVHNGRDLATELTRACQGRGIEVWGWQYIYGRMAATEAVTAARRVRETGVTGFVINAESEWKVPGMGAHATNYTRILRHEIGQQFPVCLSSYRYPNFHREFPWREFLEDCDFALPQVYWMGATDAGAQLRLTMQRYLKLYSQIGLTRPVIPTGAAFAEHGWTAQPAEVQEFLETAVSLGLPAANFWEWGRTSRAVPAAWEVIANFAWPGQVMGSTRQPGTTTTTTTTTSTETRTPPPPERRVRVVIDKYNLRNRPQIQPETDVADLHEGALLTVTGERGDWLEVRGWVNKAGVENLP